MSASKLYRASESDGWRLDRLTQDRRDILRTLTEQSLPIREWQLAAILAVERWENRSTMEARTKLRHIDLPTLADAGHLMWDQREAVVTGVALSQSDEDNAPIDRAEDTLEGDIRITLNLVETFHGPQHESALAYAVAAIPGSSDPDAEAVERKVLKLRHQCLPKLDQAGAIEYDPDEGLVRGVDAAE